MPHVHHATTTPTPMVEQMRRTIGIPEYTLIVAFIDYCDVSDEGKDSARSFLLNCPGLRLLLVPPESWCGHGAATRVGQTKLMH